MECRWEIYLITFILIISPRNIRSDSLEEEKSAENPKTDVEVKSEDQPKTLENYEMHELSNNGNGNVKDVQLLTLHEPDDGKSLNLTENDLAKFKIWPDGVIPYYIDDFSFDKVLRDRIRKYLDSYYAMTGIQFIELPHPPKDPESTRWVFIVNRMARLDCVDHPVSDFTNQGVQKLVLGYDCLQDVNSMAGIMLALLGIPPQHNAPNRDDYIEIVFDNVIPDKKSLFNKLSSSDWLFPDLPYDYLSASHYDYMEYTVNGLATVKPKKAIKESDEELHGLSAYDRKKIKRVYTQILNKKSPFKAAQCSKLFRLNNKSVGNLKQRAFRPVGLE